MIAERRRRILQGAARTLLAAGLIAFGTRFADAAAARPLEIRAERIAVAPTLLPENVDFLIGYELTSDDPSFGGLSGVEVSETELIAATDGGDFITVRVRRNDAGAIVAIGEADVVPQLDMRGELFGQGAARAEALARDVVSGLYWTAYERDHRILGRRELDGPAVAEINQLPRDGLAPFGGVRALAAARDRSVVAIVAARVRDEGEEAVDITGPVVGWRLAIDRADRFEIERSGGFRPTGADFAPDGVFYLLETKGGPVGAGALRIRRFSAEAMRNIEDGADLGAGEIVLELTEAAPIGRMEGLAVDADADGRIVLTLVAGDGENAVVPTRLLQFRLLDGRVGQ